VQLDFVERTLSLGRSREQCVRIVSDLRKAETPPLLQIFVPPATRTLRPGKKHCRLDRIRCGWTFDEDNGAVVGPFDRAYTAVDDFVLESSVGRLEPLGINGAGDTDQCLRRLASTARLHIDGDRELGIANTTFPAEDGAMP
jgi:hypothetical protein